MRPGYCFLLDGLSYLGVIAGLLAMQVVPMARSQNRKELHAELAEGWGYVAGSLPIRMLLMQLAIVSLMGAPFTVLMPVFAKDILKGGPTALGTLTSSIGLGALFGGLRLASRRSVLGLGKWIAIGGVMMGVSLLAFALSRTIWLSAAFLGCCGFAMITQMASGNTVLQTIVDDDKRGRVMAFYAMAFLGTMPIGSLMAGSVAQRFGAPLTVMCCGISCILSGVWFATRLPRLREAIRPIYERQGILPQVAEGLKAAQAEDMDKAVAG
jgi:predicted MFS family arabinose efflux permease